MYESIYFFFFRFLTDKRLENYEFQLSGKCLFWTIWMTIGQMRCHCNVCNCLKPPLRMSVWNNYQIRVLFNVANSLIQQVSPQPIGLIEYWHRNRILKPQFCSTWPILRIEVKIFRYWILDWGVQLSVIFGPAYFPHISATYSHILMV